MTTVTVTIDRQVYQRPGTSFAIYASTPDGDLFPGGLSLKGELAGLEEGDIVEVDGKLSSYQGRPQLEVVAYRIALPKSATGMAAYLARSPGIGPKSAERIVETLGADRVNELLLGDPTELAVALRVVPKLSSKAIRALVEAAREAGPERELTIYLAGLGMTAGTIKTVIRTLGMEAPALVRGDPYTLTRVPGIGFLRADGYALQAGMDRQDPRRVRAAALYVLEESSGDGHTYLPRGDLVARAAEWLSAHADGRTIGAGEVAQAVDALIESRQVKADDGDLYTPALWHAELGVADHLQRLSDGDPDLIDEALVEAAMDRYRRESGIDLSHDQAAAVRGLVEAPVAVLRGGPGTGKTTITRALLAIYRQAGLQVLLLAPTGRAAHRQSEVCGQAASTIHRALGVDPRGGGFLHNEECPLEADVVLVDESSMLDVALTHSLLRAIQTGTRVMLIGDADQLPPVGPGAVFADVITSRAIPVFHLTTIHRQAAGSEVITGAYEVLAGRVPSSRPGQDLSPTPGAVYLVPTVCRDGEDDPDRVIRWALGRLARQGVQRSDVQILAPQRKGAAGTEALNTTLQAWANPDGAPAGGGLRVGDRVLQTKNDYNLGVWNGDVGILKATGEQQAQDKDGAPKVDRTGAPVMERWVEVDFLDGRLVRYGEEPAQALDLAYAVSVHKAQGSESRIVFLVLHRSHYRMLSRAIIYTGITRARETLVLVGSNQAIALAVKDAGGVERNSRLAARLVAALGAPAAAKAG